MQNRVAVRVAGVSRRVNQCDHRLLLRDLVMRRRREHPQVPEPQRVIDAVDLFVVVRTRVACSQSGETRSQQPGLTNGGGANIVASSVIGNFTDFCDSMVPFAQNFSTNQGKSKWKSAPPAVASSMSSKRRQTTVPVWPLSTCSH